MNAVSPAPTWRAFRVLFIAFALGASVSSSAVATEQVVSDYMLSCQGCHLPDGSGFPQRGVPAFPGVLGRFLHVEGGREFLIRVPGVAQSGLSDERLATLMNWLLTTFSPNELPKDFRAFSVDEISRWRHQPLVNVTATRSDLVERMSRKHPTP
jgi:hypothetical protein